MDGWNLQPFFKDPLFVSSGGLKSYFSWMGEILLTYFLGRVAFSGGALWWSTAAARFSDCSTELEISRKTPGTEQTCAWVRIRRSVWLSLHKTVRPHATASSDFIYSDSAFSASICHSPAVYHKVYRWRWELRSRATACVKRPRRTVSSSCACSRKNSRPGRSTGGIIVSSSCASSSSLYTPPSHPFPHSTRKICA
jgi:hypothetical protein